MDTCFKVLREEYTREYDSLIKQAGNTPAIAHRFAVTRACNKAYAVHKQHLASNGFLFDYEDFKIECFSILG